MDERATYASGCLQEIRLCLRVSYQGDSQIGDKRNDLSGLRVCVRGHGEQNKDCKGDASGSETPLVGLLLYACLNRCVRSWCDLVQVPLLLVPPSLDAIRGRHCGRTAFIASSAGTLTAGVVFESKRF